MPWNSTAPLGSVSVKANRTIIQQNTSYIETTMGNSIVGTNTTSTRDHFWDVGTNEDGRHRFLNFPAFTVGAVAADPVIGTGMDVVRYVKTTNGRVQGFFRNAQGIYQDVPAFLSGTIAVPTTSYTNLVAVPANVYGEIFMWTTALGTRSSQSGSFRSDGTIVEAWGFAQSTDSESSSTPLKFASGSDATTLNIRVRRSDAASAIWNYRITYRAQ